MRLWQILTVLLAVALAASVAAGLLGLWPDLRERGNPQANRREEARIVSALRSSRAVSPQAVVTRVRVDYLPGRDLVQFEGGECVLVAKDFGSSVDHNDLQVTVCNP
jgi:type II secretory pathway component PulK